MNIDAFQDPAPFTLGNVAILPSARACPFYNENFEVDKVFPIGERVRINFGSMFSNLFNRHVLDSASGNLGWNIDQPATFGKFTFVDPPGPRAVEFFLRFEF